MCECQKLLVVAEELLEMTNNTWASQTDNSIQEIMLAQSLYGVQLKIGLLMEHIKQAISIEEAG